MPTSRHERAFRRAGYRAIAGLDEAGRGALFGPVFAAAVILDPEKPIRGLDDSKQLAPERREVLAGRIRERARSWAVAAADAFEIDHWNILAGRAPGHAPRRGTIARALRLPAGGRRERGSGLAAKSADSRRRAVFFDRRRVDPGQSRPGCRARGLGRGFSRVRLQGQQRLRHAAIIWPRSNAWAPPPCTGSVSNQCEIVHPLPGLDRLSRSPNPFLSKANYLHVPDAGAGSHLPRPPPGEIRRSHRTPRLLRLVFAIFTFEIGLFLTVFPWVDIWSLNYFSEWIPALENIWLDPYFRGAITGLGLVNIYVACAEVLRIFRRSD